jgi:hypothetical protein
MAGGGRVDHDEVGAVGPLELLDLPQHEDVLDPGYGRGDHVQGPRGHQPPGDAAHAVVLEVLEKGVVGREGPGPDLGGAGQRRGEDDLLVGEGIGVAEGGGKAALALDLDDEGGEPGFRRHPGQRRAHRGFADATLASDDEQPGLGAEPDRIHPSQCAD